MTIETGPAQNGPRPAATESKTAKGKPGEAHGQGTGGAGGFMSILAALDTSELALPATGTDSALPGDGPAPNALAALARAAGKLKGTGQPGDGEGNIDPASAEESPGKLLSNVANDLAAGLSASTDAHLTPDLPPDASGLLAQAAQWLTASTANTEPANLGTAGGAMGGVVPNFAALAKPLHVSAKSGGPAVSNPATGDAVTELAGKVGKAQKDAFARLASVQAALRVPADTSSPAADARQAQLLQKVTETPLGPVAVALAAANMVAPARREESVRERSVFRTNASDGTSSVNQSSYMPSTSGASGPSAPDPVTSTDTYVAEKVAYWISNDVQNAEMKLDGIGDKPVEVSIRMQGNEAHIAFRSDELQARAALENAGIHLKDMLQREGLVLSGVSVGTSGTGDSGDQGNKSRQGARQSGIATVQPARVNSTPGPGRVSGGALDLFV